MKNLILRWILFLPLAIIGAAICALIWGYINRVTIGSFIKVDSTLFNLYDFPTTGLILGTVYVFIGVSIVPNKKKSVSLILLFLSILFSVVTILGNFFLIKDIDNWIILLLIFSMIGSTVAYNFLKNQID